MKKRKKSKVLLVALATISTSVFVLSSPAHADCPAGFGNAIEINATTGVVTYSCVPISIPQPISTQTPAPTPSATPIPTPTPQATTVPSNDPFPTLSSGQVVPGTTVSGQQSITCPAGSSSGIEVNATTHAVSTYCVKTYQSQSTINAQSAFASALAAAQASALALSQAWNTAHPGQQKCFQWGPVTSPTGGTQSGGVCANPVGTLLPNPAPSDTTTATATIDTATAQSGIAATSSRTVSKAATKTVSKAKVAAKIQPKAKKKS